MSDKPAWLRERPLLNPAQVREIDNLYARRLRTLQAVDDMLASFVATLRAAGALDRTYLFFTSDNGFHLGQHRLPPGKQTAFEEDIHVPLLVRGPGIAAGSASELITENVDLASTFADLAGAKVPVFVDGRSLVPLLRGGRPADWRTAALVEHYGGTQPGDPDDDAAFLQATPDAPPAGLPGPPAQPRGITTYEAVRTGSRTFVEYTTGEHELYDRTRDPFEEVNGYATAERSVIDDLQRGLNALRSCKGQGCREADRVVAGR